jgi:N-methylhydantoinase A
MPGAGAGPWRVGIDTGGTFADIVIRPPGAKRVQTAKLPRDAGAGRLAQALLDRGVPRESLVVHGTTHVTNAILEGDFARTGLVTTRGFADVLRIARQSRDDLYELERPARLEAIVPPELTYELCERCAPDGVVTQGLDGEQLADLRRWVRERRVEALAVCLLHAYANPEHERRVGDAVGDLVAVSLSHQVSPEVREYERATATVLNAAVQLSTRTYLQGLEEAIAGAVDGAKLFVVQSAGGMVPTEAACARPLATVMSGPAAGAAAVSMLARRTGIERAVACDIGGTSTDVSVILDGTPAVARDRTVGGRVVQVPAIAVESIAVGGGSIVAFDDVDALTIGPRSAGAVPGPACYGRGGIEPTVTDAALVCGLVGSGGGVPGLGLDRSLAERALARVAAQMGIGVEDLAWRSLDVAQGKIAQVLSTVVSRRGYDIRGCTLVAYGGGGPVHAAALAERLGIERVVVPVMAPVFSALGCCLAEVGVEAVRTHRCLLADGSLPELDGIAHELVVAESERLGEPLDGIDVARWLELRYLGQNAELAVDWARGADAASLTRALAAAHEREYGFVSNDPIEVTAVRCRIEVAAGRAWPAADVEPGEPGAGGAPCASRGASAELIVTGGDRLQVPLVSLSELRSAGRLSGPALIAARFGSITVSRGQVASIDADANVVLEMEQ